MTLHPAVEHLAPLVGTWRGRGHGHYPTIHDFDYRDEIQFISTPKPFLLYRQSTWIGEEPMHVETGYVRAPSPDVIEVVIAIPSGQTENGAGTCRIEDGAIHIETDAGVVCTPAAKQVDRITRVLDCFEDDLVYDMSMTAVGRPHTHHLRSQLTRVRG